LPEIYTLSLHDALPIYHALERTTHANRPCVHRQQYRIQTPEIGVADRLLLSVDDGLVLYFEGVAAHLAELGIVFWGQLRSGGHGDRKSTRLNSSHVKIS